MPTPASDLFPSSTIFPGTPIPVSSAYGAPALVEIAIDDLVLTATDGQGCTWIAQTLDGWWGSSASSVQFAQKTRSPGAWSSPRQLQPRTIVITGVVQAPTQAALIDAENRLNAAAAIDDRIFTVSEAGSIRSCIVKRQDIVLIQRITDTASVWSLQLVAADPRKFTAAVTSSTTLPSSSGGLTVPFTVPFTIASTVVSGNCALNNPGNINGPVVLRIDGPVVGPVVTHVGSGLQLVFSSSLSLAAGEWIDVDMEAQTVLANGQSSRNGWVTGRGWSAFEPGNNLWSFAAAYGTGLLRITATPAWQ